MALKRALVVDDSKVARITLKNQLEAYDLRVELAESGEDALELLKTHMVDVIFMDHIMPGMDGLEAVSLIKSNPATATIPVMMYTSKEGEVYVSEARALGAVGVLPKRVEPGVLFGMLEKLGLVKDRRGKSNGGGTDAEGEAADVGDKPLGIEVSRVVSRILEDQHIELRSDILNSYRGFAKEVAVELHDQMREDQRIEEVEQELARRQQRTWRVASILLAFVVVIVGMQWLHVRSERDAAMAELSDARAALEQERQAATARQEQLATITTAEQSSFESAERRQYLDRLIRDMNAAGAVPFYEVPFNEARVDDISWLMLRLTDAGFEGTLQIESHLGAFCLVSDASGIYQLEDADAPFTSCSFIGHPLDGSRLLSDRQTSHFEFFRAASPLLADSGIDLQVVIRDRTDSVPRVPYPDNPQTAGDWNRIAAINNRLEYALLPGDAL